MADQHLTVEFLTELTAEIVSIYVTKNPVPVSELPSVIASVFQSLSNLNGRQEPTVEPLKPKVPIKKSVTRDFIISLEDGKQYKTLKRHLTALGLTPEGYRAKWLLPADYPMVAESYAEQRSALAKKLGLGRKPDQKRGRKRGGSS
ncbi:MULTISPECIES: MucR family transcriptional regulator [Phyllobacteriaceae]|jgi:predicted transcriptional regulator|uniref:MucR family transcriptional regulator n=1 Tax=Mesorhizobium hungaricum TaxID=1566387 RepID=A0A1C2DMS0_9HYPH|nr:MULTISPECIES: MucR family transcriptional regulator [Mesorhizobium]MBN9236900.1 MucR family transcriptional regulator [Mesorhizobium sp.]MDQ0328165.1 putative transcriptional regulator [Mesorhizobium sp. YL-MeA3-2017]OCX16049.1 MucR family transcriptional regulator [Mesorhizobium hungaricum]